MEMSRNLLILMLVLIPGIGTAQVVPDAGTLERDANKPLGNQQPKKDKQPISIPTPAKPETGQSKVQVFVRAFTFQGNTLFSDQELGQVLKPYVEQKLNFDQINAAVRSIAHFYRSAGWLVRTGLPKQDITDGVIIIGVMEATFAGANIADPSSVTRILPEIISDVINARSPLKQKFNINNLERSMLIADDLPGVNVTGALSAGTKPGETALQLSLSDEPLLTGKIGIDNLGSRATGSERAQVNLNVNSPLKIGDLLNFRAIHSRGSDYVQLNYSRPVWLLGLRLGVNVAYLDYKLISKELSALDAKGDFNSVGMNAAIPAPR